MQRDEPLDLPAQLMQAVAQRGAAEFMLGLLAQQLLHPRHDAPARHAEFAQAVLARLAELEAIPDFFGNAAMRIACRAYAEELLLRLQPQRP